MCGIAGAFGHPEAANLVYLMLYAEQHRGEEGAGISSSNGRSVFLEKGFGEVRIVFDEKRLKKLSGSQAIGQVRYSTTGESSANNVQPIRTEYAEGAISIAHNGNLVNAHSLKEELKKAGAVFQTSTDTELILHLIAKSEKKDLLDKVFEALRRIKGAFNLLILTKDELIVVRDSLGFRPLCLGELDGASILASESCGFDLIGAKYKREIRPGEVLMINKKGRRSYFPFPNPGRTALCIFELIYFSRPDSRVFKGILAYHPRTQLGRELSKEDPLKKADFVVPVPDSANRAALGYSWQSKIPLDLLIIRNHYIGRLFIEPEQKIRDFGAKLKFNAVPDVCRGKELVVVDDSIVRGTNSRKINRMIWKTGVEKIHFRSSCPPIKFPCHYGIDMQLCSELIAGRLSIEAVRKRIRATTLRYLSLEGMYRAVEMFGFRRGDFCDACFTGKYPIKIPKGAGKFSLEP